MSAGNRWSFWKCTKTALLSPNTGRNCRQKRNWSKKFTSFYWKRRSGSSLCHRDRIFWVARRAESGALDFVGIFVGVIGVCVFFIVENSHVGIAFNSRHSFNKNSGLKKFSDFFNPYFFPSNFSSSPPISPPSVEPPHLPPSPPIPKIWRARKIHYRFNSAGPFAGKKETTGRTPRTLGAIGGTESAE